VGAASTKLTPGRDRHDAMTEPADNDDGDVDLRRLPDRSRTRTQGDDPFGVLGLRDCRAGDRVHAVNSAAVVAVTRDRYPPAAAAISASTTSFGRFSSSGRSSSLRRKNHASLCLRSKR